ncbi:MAG: hypothetical protein MK116_14170, partial [Phycisphaerales bacterium]|nr:hypothetical protein [Phycisphaerales bacterium]
VLICQNEETEETVFQNLVIQNGFISGSWPDDLGGGMYNHGSSPRLVNCTFTSNSAGDGGGMHN